MPTPRTFKHKKNIMHTFKTILLKLLPSLIVSAAIIVGIFVVCKNFEHVLLETHKLTRSYNEEALGLMFDMEELLDELKSAIIPQKPSTYIPLDELPLWHQR